MCNFEFSFTGNERKLYKDIYIVVIYDWSGKDDSAYEIRIINCIPFLSRVDAENYKEKFDKTTHGECQAMIIQRY